MLVRINISLIIERSFSLEDRLLVAVREEEDNSSFRLLEVPTFRDVGTINRCQKFWLSSSQNLEFENNNGYGWDWDWDQPWSQYDGNRWEARANIVYKNGIMFNMIPLQEIKKIIPTSQNRILACSDEEIWVMDNSSRNKVFTSRESKIRDVFFSRSSREIYVATPSCVYRMNEEKNMCKKLHSDPFKYSFRWIAYKKKYGILATDEGNLVCIGRRKGNVLWKINAHPIRGMGLVGKEGVVVVVGYNFVLVEEGWEKWLWTGESPRSRRESGESSSEEKIWKIEMDDLPIEEKKEEIKKEKEKEDMIAKIEIDDHVNDNDDQNDKDEIIVSDDLEKKRKILKLLLDEAYKHGVPYPEEIEERDGSGVCEVHPYRIIVYKKADEVGWVHEGMHWVLGHLVHPLLLPIPVGSNLSEIIAKKPHIAWILRGIQDGYMIVLFLACKMPEWIPPEVLEVYKREVDFWESIRFPDFNDKSLEAIGAMAVKTCLYGYWGIRLPVQAQYYDWARAVWGEFGGDREFREGEIEVPSLDRIMRFASGFQMPLFWDGEWLDVLPPKEDVIKEEKKPSSSSSLKKEDDGYVLYSKIELD